jgi:hypothetical protein
VCKMTPVSPLLTPPRLRTGESMHLVSFWPSPTSRARRERQRRASGTRWWVGAARFCVQEGYFFPCKMTTVSPYLTPPRLRTGESMHLDSFWPSPTSKARREHQRRASGTRWWVKRARFCVQEGCFFPCTMTPVSPHPPRLRTGESMHLVSFCKARRERQRGYSVVRWRVGRARFCVQEGCFFPLKIYPFSPHLTPPRLRTGESMHLVSFWPSPTSRARREHQRRASGTRWWVGRARFCAFFRVK